jgi:3D-(3,5/4)-trihydroxycyclohexane-1,2-dione acylhydrolase (decyclizing)
VDFVKLAEGFGASAVRATTLGDVEKALEAMRSEKRTSVLVVEVDKEERVPGYESWWDVPISAVSDIESIRQARARYEEVVKKERRYEVAVPGR